MNDRTNEQAEERTCAYVFKDSGEFNGEVCEGKESHGLHVYPPRHNCPDEHHPFTPAPSEEPKPRGMAEPTHDTRVVLHVCSRCERMYECALTGVHDFICGSCPPEPKDATCNSECWTHTEHSLVCDYRKAKGQRHDAVKDEQPKEVRSVGRRISELRQVSRQVSMDASATKRQLEKLHEHADELYYEFAAIMRQMGWKR